jgi:hypothetical protein
VHVVATVAGVRPEDVWDAETARTYGAPGTGMFDETGHVRLARSRHPTSGRLSST